MRTLSLLVTLALCCAAQAAGVAQAPASLLKGLDFSISYYGPPKRSTAYVVGVEPFNRWVINLGQYGGDGDNPGQHVVIYGVSSYGNERALLLAMEDVTIEELGDNYFVKGRQVLSLCLVCDTWEVADPQDVFFLPTRITLPGPVVEADISPADAESLLAQIVARAKVVQSQQAQYDSDGRYAKFATALVARANAFLSRSNKPLHPTPTAAEAPASGAGERRRYAAQPLRSIAGSQSDH